MVVVLTGIVYLVLLFGDYGQGTKWAMTELIMNPRIMKKHKQKFKAQL